MPSRAILGLSHTPLLGLTTLPPAVDAELSATLDLAARHVEQFNPELVVMFAPDHFNGFFYNLMPPFCIGSEGESVGDYGTPAGALNVASQDALDLAQDMIQQGFDIAVSRRMVVDHGFAQSMELMFGSLRTPPLIPVFINAIGLPSVPTARRCVQLGNAVGRHFDADPRRILFIGSGGLSHDPPIPAADSPDPAIRDRLLGHKAPTAEQRRARQELVIALGHELAAGQSSRRPLNPAWDQNIMSLLERGDWAALARMRASDILAEGGSAANEINTWVAAFATQPTARLTTVQSWYRAIPELVAGFGVMLRMNS